MRWSSKSRPCSHSVPLLGPEARGQVSDPAVSACGSRLYVVYVWVTSSPISVGRSHTPFGILEGFKVMQSMATWQMRCPSSPAYDSHREERATALYVVEAQKPASHQMGA